MDTRGSGIKGVMDWRPTFSGCRHPAVSVSGRVSGRLLPFPLGFPSLCFEGLGFPSLSLFSAYSPWVAGLWIAGALGLWLAGTWLPWRGPCLAYPAKYVFLRIAKSEPAPVLLSAR